MPMRLSFIGRPSLKDRSPPDLSGGLQYASPPLLVDHVEHCRDRNRNRIRHVVVVRLHRNNLAWLRGTLLTFRNVRHRVNDAPLNRIHLEHTHTDLHSFPGDIGRTVDRVAEVELAHRNKTLDVVADVDDYTLVHQPYDRALELCADRIRLADLEPWIILRLLQSERDALVVGIDVQDDDIDSITLLHDL